MSASHIKLLYVIATVLELAGVSSLVTRLVIGRERAKSHRTRKPHFGPVFRRTDTEPDSQQIARQQEKLATEQSRQERHLLGLLEGHWTEWLGGACLLVGILVGAIANIANTN
jgi:hypothetical protein